MTNATLTSREAFIEALTPEFNRAWTGVTERNVQSYDLYIGTDGELEAMAEPINHDGATFATLTPDMADGWDTPEQYLEFYGAELFTAYQRAQ